MKQKLDLNTIKQRSLPLVLCVLLFLADQLSKILVVHFIPLNSAAWSFGGDFFRLIHVRNKAIAFSLGAGIPEFLRILLFILLPLLFLGVTVYFLITTNQISKFQRWVLAALLGGGMGNVLDRIVRSQGVVDFLDFKFYGIFGLERWPAFNLADSFIVIAVSLLVLSFIMQTIKENKKEGLNGKGN